MDVSDTPLSVAGAPAIPFGLRRLGIVMRAEPDDPREAWGVLNPGGVRGRDGAYYLFPRAVAEGNYSRIGRGRVEFNAGGDPIAVTSLGYALEPREPYERSAECAGVEDPRVTFLRPLDLFVMTYTAYAAHHPQVALAVSRDLETWQRLGPVCYARQPGRLDLNECSNKDGLIFPDVVYDQVGRSCIALLHRPTPKLPLVAGTGQLTALDPRQPEAIWISYVPLDEARADPHRLSHVDGHRALLEPMADWEAIKIGGGAPPVLLPYGWMLLYHGVSSGQTAAIGSRRYCAGVAILNRDDPTTVLYRSTLPILEPVESSEIDGVVPNVVFPTATDLRGPDRLDVYYGAADAVIGVARMAIPPALPAQE
jgi:beta-1,2-mannobiose phosphorylase / 1,2-beta-oligomannan phosphorylase